MKKVLFLIAFMFAVVCYAAPPPDVGFVPVTDNEISVLQVVASEVSPVFVMFEAQEVATVYTGDRVIKTGAEIICSAVKIKIAELPVMNYTTTNLIALNKPPSNDSMAGVLNSKSAFRMDKQHSNYGYPLTAN